MEFRTARDVVAGALFCLTLTGCSLGPLAKQTASFATATQSFTQNASRTYARAEDIHELTEFDALISGPIPANFNPEAVKPLFAPEDMAARTKALGALSSYADKLNDIALNADKKSLEKASRATGSSVSALAGDAGLTSAAGKNAIVSTAIYAIGEFIETRHILKTLPREIQKVDPAVQGLCKVFEDDAGVMQREATDALEQRIEKLTTNLEESQSKLDFDQRRSRVQEIQATVRNKQQIEMLSVKFKASANQLALAHSALAAGATGKDSQGLQKKIRDLKDAVQDLSDYYQFAAK